MPVEPHEDTWTYLQRLLREDRERTWPAIQSSRKAIEESRELLKKIDQEHPGT